MSEFSASSSFLFRKQFFTRYYYIMSRLSLRSADISASVSILNDYSGFGIEQQIKMLNICYDRLQKCKEDMRTEFYALVKIVDTINEYEGKASELLGGNELDQVGIVFAKPQPPEEMKTISHEDLGKILAQLKYYTQSENSDTYIKLYEFYKGFYDKNQSLTVTKSDYSIMKDMFARMVNYSNYTYTSVKYFKSKADINGKSDLSLGYSDEDGGKGRFSLDSYKASASEGFTSMEIKTSTKVGKDYVNYTITLSDVSLDGDVKLGSIDFAEIMKKAGKKKLSLKDWQDYFSPAGIKISGSGSCIQATSQTIKNINNDISYVCEMTYTIGEVTAELGVSVSGVKAELGASVASVKAEHGIITNSGKYTVGGKVNAGVELGGKLGEGDAEVSMGMFSLSGEIDDGFDYYVWE